MVNTKRFLNSTTGKKLPDHIKSSSIFNNIQKIDKVFPKIGLKNRIEKIKLNLNGKPLYVGFSSDGIKGLWDIATMSMRGINSCMRWSSNHSYHLIGSIIDPYTGLVFLTDKSKTEHGIKLYKRAVVRLMVYIKDGKHIPALFIERPYKDHGYESAGSYFNGDKQAVQTFGIFKRFLERYLNKDIEIYSEDPYHMPNCDIGLDPYVPIESCMKNLAYNYLPFSDAGFRYEENDSGSKVIQSLLS
jgi:hypothetical protein